MTTCYAWIFNNPYPDEEANKKIYYTSFAEQPKTLDPARSYSVNEYQFIAQIYEPPLQYDYYQRPYKLVPLTANGMPEIRYYDSGMHEVISPQTQPIAYTVYTIKIKPGIYYQPHPAFAKTSTGLYRYLHLPPDFFDEKNYSNLNDFPYSDTREVTAADYVYEIKRLADPVVESPIYGLMSEHIVGFHEFAKSLPEHTEQQFINLHQYPLQGVQQVDRYTYTVTLKDQYSQFIYWLAMPFFSPVPWEADQFYSQEGMDDNNLAFDWYPVGSGPFMLIENNPNRRMRLIKNPFFHEEYFPNSTDQNDINHGYTRHAGEKIPLIDEVIFTLEKESIPRWNKFLQGYYDTSGVTADSFEQAIHVSAEGEALLTPAMKKQGIRLTQSTDPNVTYIGFNMLDPIVGGTSIKARKLRQAISIVINFDEYIAIFYNGRGLPAQGPIPIGIFGYQEGETGINPFVYHWQDGRRSRRSLNDARQLMVEAGYPNGRDPKTGRALILNYDVPIKAGPDEKSELEWMMKQFAKLGIDLTVRGTQYNRFQEKMRAGNAQIFSWSWIGDYPDPENFLSLLYGKNGKVKFGGENAANYSNPEYDRLFDMMKNGDNNPKRLEIIKKMLEIVRRDAPWVWGMNPETFVLTHSWISSIKTNPMNINTLKFVAIDVPLRNKLREQWNKPVLWPLGVIILAIIVLLFPMIWVWQHREKSPALREKR